MQGGETFRLRGVADRHTWVVVSDPMQDPVRVYCVAFTSHDLTKDQACIVQPAEYPLLDHASCIDYFDVKVASVAALEAGTRAGLIEKRASVSAVLLRKIRLGFNSTRDTKFEYVEFLIAQGLI